MMIVEKWYGAPLWQPCCSVSVILLSCSILKVWGLGGSTDLRLHFLSYCFFALRILCWSTESPSSTILFLILFASLFFFNFPTDRPKIRKRYFLCFLSNILISAGPRQLFSCHNWPALTNKAYLLTTTYAFEDKRRKKRNGELILSCQWDMTMFIFYHMLFYHVETGRGLTRVLTTMVQFYIKAIF